HAMDFSYFNEVNEVIQEEPNAAMDSETLGLLASIGIEKGKLFAPDERMKKILTDAAAVGTATVRALAYRSREPLAHLFANSAWQSAVHRRQLRVRPRRCASARCALVLLLCDRHYARYGREDGRGRIAVCGCLRRLAGAAARRRQNL